MKQSLLIIATLLLSLSSCQGQQQQKDNKNEEKTIATQEGKTNKQVEELTTEGFKSKIMDFDKHPQEWVYKGKRPAFIDFYATWCGPCKAISPLVEEMSNEFKGKVDFFKVDVDKQPELAMMFGIQSIPALLFIPMNGTPEMTFGALDKEELRKSIETKLLK